MLAVLFFALIIACKFINFLHISISITPKAKARPKKSKDPLYCCDRDVITKAKQLNTQNSSASSLQYSSYANIQAYRNTFRIARISTFSAFGDTLDARSLVS